MRGSEAWKIVYFKSLPATSGKKQKQKQNKNEKDLKQKQHQKPLGGPGHTQRGQTTEFGNVPLGENVLNVAIE